MPETLTAVAPEPPAPPKQPAAPAPPSPAPPAPTLRRRFGDPDALRTAIYDSAMQAVKDLPPPSNTRFTLSLHEPHYEGPDIAPKAAEKDHLLRGKTLARRLRGTWRLTDNATGKPVAERLMTLARIPVLTPRNTFIVDGSDYILASQSRLRPGVYTRRTGSGDVESHINVAGRGAGHRVFLEPATGLFKMRIDQAEVPIIPMLKSLGANDDELRQAWGAGVLQANSGQEKPHHLQRLLDKFGKRRKATEAPLTDPGEMQAALAEGYRDLRLDPWVTKQTLGKPYHHLDKDVLLAVTRRLLDVNRGRAGLDDREHPAYQHVMGPEDLIAERLSKSRGALAKTLWQATYHGNLERLPIGLFDPAIKALLNTSGLASAPEGIGATEFVDHGSRLTRLGEGGLSSRAIPEESTAVHPGQLGFIDLIKAPESESVGVDMRVAFGVHKGSDGMLYAPFRDPYTGRIVYKSPQDTAESSIALPGELQSGRRWVRAVDKGRLRYVRRDRIGLELPSMEQAFSPLTNMVVMKSAAKGQRSSMGARFIAQALPLTNAEAPLVRTGVPGQPGKSFEELYGRHAGAVLAPQAGRVLKVSSDAITVQYADGTKQTHDLYNNQPSNRKTAVHNTPLVQRGQEIQPGQVLAKSNFTDDKGHVAYGRNARIAYVAAHGLPYEDAGLISESFAKQMTSEHTYQHEHTWDDSHRRGKGPFVSLFPGVYDRKTLDKIGNDGIIQVGQPVKYGDPLILAAQARERDHAAVGRSTKMNFADRSVTWDHHDPGVVTDVVPTRDGVNVVVKSMSEMKTGDKLAGRHGNKSVVTVIPDHQMPHDSQGRPFDAAISPFGMTSRINPAWAIEGSLGKVAAKTGRPYVIHDWTDIPSLAEFAHKEMQKYGVPDQEDIHDPVSGRTIPGVMTGHMMLMKLHHQAEAKGSGRGLGAYDASGAPQRGAGGKALRFSLGDTNAILSHGSLDVLRDAHAVRGSGNNEDYWAAYMAGFPTPHPKVPQQYVEFLHKLTASGVHPRRDGPRLHLMAVTDKLVNQLAGSRELKNAETVRFDKDMAGIPGGLFDPAITGGHGSQAGWAKITLQEPMPNPAFEEPIRRVLGLTEKKFLGVLSGKEEYEGKTGPKALYSALDSIDLPKAIAATEDTVKNGRKTARDEAVRRLRYLRGAAKQEIHPREWFLKAAPVLPPAFRPVSRLQGGKGQLVADPNLLYKELFDANEVLGQLKGKVDDLSSERLGVYNAFKAVTGLGDPTHPKNAERGVRGILRQLLGDSGKFSYMQQKLLGTSVDLAGRAVIVPNPDLDMDQVGLPENQAWDVFKPLAVRELTRKGVAPGEAVRAVEERSHMAREALVEVMNHNPVIVNRYPIMHRYSVMAMRPKMFAGNVLHLNPLVFKGYGADVDGDMMQFHVPVGASTHSVEKMLPSNNLLALSNFKAHFLPQTEHAQGLHAASTTRDKQKPVHFHTKEDMIRAYKRGEIGQGTPVIIDG